MYKDLESSPRNEMKFRKTLLFFWLFYSAHNSDIHVQVDNQLINEISSSQGKILLEMWENIVLRRLGMKISILVNS